MFFWQTNQFKMTVLKRINKKIKFIASGEFIFVLVQK